MSDALTCLMGPRVRRSGKADRSPGLGLLLLLLVPFLVLGCASRRQPDLRLLYRDWSSQIEGRPPLIGIPGLMGSELVDPRTGEVLWGRPKGLLSTAADTRLALPMEPGEETPLVAPEGIQKIGPVDVYESSVKVLVEGGGYTPVTQPGPIPQAPLFTFSYDWRLSCASNAGRLAALITSIQKRSNDPSLKVDIVAHSMGGLIARYYILYGDRDVLNESDPVPSYAGAANVRKLIMLGTPNTGSAAALLALIDVDRLGLARLHPDLVATMPSMVELMPSPSVTALFLSDGSPAPIDIYDVATWKDNAWGIFDPAQIPGILERFETLHPGADKGASTAYLLALQTRFAVLLTQAARFHRALEAGSVPASVQTMLLGGDCTPTARGFVVERENGRWIVRRRPKDVRRPSGVADLSSLYYGPGDGRVTKASLLAEVETEGRSESGTYLPHAVPGFICEQHRKLGNNWTFRDNLLHFLLYKPLSTGVANDASRP